MATALRSTSLLLLIGVAAALPACKRESAPEPNAPAAAQVTADTAAQPARSTDVPAAEEAAAPNYAPTAAAISPAQFADRVWKVKEGGSVEAGTTYAFLADGTLVIDSPNGTPMIGRWTFVDGALTMIEEGVSYPTQILKLDAGQFTLLSHNPGQPVEIALVPAPGVPLPKEPAKP